VDCGGQGQCGPNTLGYLLGLVDCATVDGPQLRKAVVQHALAPAHRSRHTRFRDRQGRFYTLEGLILRCLSDDLGHSPGALMHTVEAWCHSIAKPASWTDLAFLQVAAQAQRLSHLEYPNADARDRARSSWAPHRKTCQALVNLQFAGVDRAAGAPAYITLIARFAANWFCSGHPVPAYRVDAGPNAARNRARDTMAPLNNRTQTSTYPLIPHREFPTVVTD
jgi:hypothetical protein